MRTAVLFRGVLPEWLNGTHLLAEGEDAAAAAAAAAAASKEGSTEGEGETDPEDTTGLKSALQKERARARLAEKALRDQTPELTRLQEEAAARASAELTDVERLKAENDALLASVSSLAMGYAQNKIDSAIRTAAEKHGFTDPDDAVALINKGNITYTQDKKNPSEVTVDLATVETEVKDLVTRKPHLKKAGTEDGGPSGSPFGGSGGGKKKADEEALKARYPSLR